MAADVEQMTLAARFQQEMQPTLDCAEHEFSTNLHICARLMLLDRLVRSSDRKAELNFLFGSVQKIIQEGCVNETAEEEAQETADLLSALETIRQEEPVGKIFSAMTDVLDRMSPKGFYRFVADLRREPIHSEREAETIPPVLEKKETNEVVPKLAMPPPAPETPTGVLQTVMKPVDAPVNGVTPEQKKAPERKFDQGLQNLLQELSDGNARINSLNSDLIATKQKLENFESSFTQNSQRLEVLQKELSKVPKRLEEIEETLTTIIRNALQSGN